MSSENLHRDYLLVRRWAEKVGLTLDDLHDDLGSKPFAEVCGIGDGPIGLVEEIRVIAMPTHAPLVIIAESRGYDMPRFIRLNWAWLKEFYSLTESDAPAEQEGWVEPTGQPISEFQRNNGSQ